MVGIERTGQFEATSATAAQSNALAAQPGPSGPGKSRVSAQGGIGSKGVPSQSCAYETVAEVSRMPTAYLKLAFMADPCLRAIAEDVRITSSKKLQDHSRVLVFHYSGR